MARPKKTEICPAGGVGVGGMLRTFIWFHLRSGPKRFGELQRLIPQASRQMLTLQLRELEGLGVLSRVVYPQQPPKVEYVLTALGQASGEKVRRFVAWGEWFCAQADLSYVAWLVTLGTKWKFWIWLQLLSGAKRFSELQRMLPQVSSQILTRELRGLEEMAVVQRHVTAESTLKVDYALTDLGQRSAPMLRQMVDWGAWFCAQSGLEYDWPVAVS